MSKTSLNGKVCLIFGEATEECYDIIESFAKDGCTVAYMHREMEEKEKLIRRLGMNAQYLFFFNGRREVEEDIEYFVNGTIGQFEKIDYIINYAASEGCRGLGSCCFDEMVQGFRYCAALPLAAIKLAQDDLAEDAVFVNITKCHIGEDGKNEECCLVQASIKQVLETIAHMLGDKIRTVGLSVGWEISQKTFGKPLNLVETVRLMCDRKSDFINGTIIPYDGALTSAVLYSNEDGWEIEEK